MTEVVMETPVIEKKPNKLAMVISCLLAFPLAAVMYIMIGISGGFIHGVGFVPRFWLWKWLFSPFVAWPLMIWGYYTWFFS